MATDTLCTPEKIEQALNKVDDSADLSEMFTALGMNDLSGLDFGKEAAAEFELDSISFNSAEFNNTKFDSANLEDVLFMFCNLTRVSFNETRAAGVNISNSRLTRCNFFRANLRSAVVNHCDITGCRFDYADMTGMQMIENTQSITQKLSLVSRDDFRTLESTLSELQPGDEVSLKHAILNNANLSGVCLVGADLTGAELIDTDLGNTDLRYSNLVDVIGADSNKTFCNATLSHAKINRDLAIEWGFDFYETDQPGIVKIDHPPFANLMASTGT